MRQFRGRRGGHEHVDRHEPRAGARGERRQHGSRRFLADDHGGAGVADDVVELRGRVRRGQRHRDTARAPDAALHGGIREAARHEKGDARLVQIVASVEQGVRTPPRRLVQVVVGERPVTGDDRCPRYA